MSDGTDGNLDITSGADFVTISWTKFHYTPRTDNSGNDSTGATGHRFSNLIGSGDDVPADVGHLNVTWHHDWWAENVNQRMPRSRNGKIHMYNNLFTSAGNSYCTNSGFQTHLLVENNVYNGVKQPAAARRERRHAGARKPVHRHQRHDDGERHRLHAAVPGHAGGRVRRAGGGDGGRGPEVTRT